MARSTTQGPCYLCGGVYTKTSMRTHLLKEMEPSQEPQLCYLIRVEGKYDPDYWIYLDMPITASLSSLDGFLRKIWLECCGHMSMFYLSGYREIGQTTKLSSFMPGDKIHYDYDMGSTTTLVITIIAETERPKQRNAVRLLARNAPLMFACAKCGAPAQYVNAEEYPKEFLCQKCSESDEDAYLLPVTNSPRVGECGYCGIFDKYAYVPPKKKIKADLGNSG